MASRSTCMFFVQLWEVLVMVVLEWGWFFNGRIYALPPVVVALQWWLRWHGDTGLSCIRRVCLLCKRKQRGGADVSSGNGITLKRPKILAEEKHFWCKGKNSQFPCVLEDEVHSSVVPRVHSGAATCQERQVTWLWSPPLPECGLPLWPGLRSVLLPRVQLRSAATRCFRLMPACHPAHTGLLCGGKWFGSVCGWCVRLNMLCGDWVGEKRGGCSSAARFFTLCHNWLISVLISKI